MRKYIVREGQRIKLPSGSCLVERRGNEHIYYHSRSDKWFFLKKVRGGWEVKEMGKEEFKACCEG